MKLLRTINYIALPLPALLIFAGNLYDPDPLTFGLGMMFFALPLTIFLLLTLLLISMKVNKLQKSPDQISTSAGKKSVIVVAVVVLTLVVLSQFINF